MNLCALFLSCHTSHENHLTKTWNTSKAFQLGVKVINPDEHNGKIDCNIAQKRNIIRGLITFWKNYEVVARDLLVGECGYWKEYKLKTRVVNMIRYRNEHCPCSIDMMFYTE